MLSALAALLAFSWLPGGHEPRPPRRPRSIVKPFFVADMQRLVRPDRVAWQPRETATPVLDGAETRLYLGTADGMLRCKFRGRTSWIYQAGGSILASPLVEGDTLYVTAADGYLTALNRYTGAVRWQSDVHEELTTPPTLSGDRVFVMSSEESVTAVDLKDGKGAWKFHRDPPGGFTIRGNAQPRAAHGTVYAGFADGTVAALNPADGSVRWTRPVSGTGEYLDIDWIEAPEGEQRVYAASAKVGVVALDAATGEAAWVGALPGANHVVVDGPRVIGGGRGALVAFDRANGKQVWRLDLPKERYTTQPVVAQGILLVSEDRGRLLALDARTGALRDTFDPGTGFSQAVLALRGAAFVVSNGGSLFSLGLLP